MVIKAAQGLALTAWDILTDAALREKIMVNSRRRLSGRSLILFGARYVTQADWWRLGFILTTVNVIIWLGIGGAW